MPSVRTFSMEARASIASKSVGLVEGNAKRPARCSRGYARPKVSPVNTADALASTTTK